METNPEKSDIELVALTLRDSNNFYFLMKRYESRLLRYIHRISNVDNPSAEDILQDTFIKIYQNLNGFDLDLKFSSWVYRITHNEIISHIRKMKVRPQTINSTEEDIAELINILPDNTNLAKEYEREELAKKVHEIINNLSENYKTVLILRFMEDKSYEEISDILQKPMGTIATLVNRAKKQFEQLALKNNLQ